MELKKVQLVTVLLYVSAIVLALLAAVIRNLIPVVGAVVCVIAETTIRLRYWKCPHCGRYLGKQMGAQHCRACGKTIEL